VYALIDLRVATAGAADIDAALRAGTASGRFNTFDRYVGAALTASHLWDSRPDDALGLGIAHARAGAPYRALRNIQDQPATAGETIVELVYRAPLTDWLCVLPLVQYVRDPGVDPALGDSWIAGLRFEVTRERSWPLSARHELPKDDAYARTQP
jgi:porin